MGMINERAKAYSEVYAIIKMMNPQYFEMIPKKFQNIIIDEMDKNYNPKINMSIPLKEQELTSKTYTILAIINLNYWCVSNEHKEKLIEKYSNNEKKDEENKKRQYNLDNIFENKNHNDKKKIINSLTTIEYHESFLKKLLDKVKKIFYK